MFISLTLKSKKKLKGLVYFSDRYSYHHLNAHTMVPSIWIVNHLNNKKVKVRYSDASAIQIPTVYSLGYFKYLNSPKFICPLYSFKMLYVKNLRYSYFWLRPLSHTLYIQIKFSCSKPLKFDIKSIENMFDWGWVNIWTFDWC